MQDELIKKYPIIQFFKYDHLPPHLQAISEPFAVLALANAAMPTDHPAEMVAGLRKLLEAKDCMVRASLKR